VYAEHPLQGSVKREELNHLLKGIEMTSEWKKKIKELFKNPDIETSLVNKYTKNNKTTKCLLWKIEHMSFSEDELINIYNHCTKEVAASVDKVIIKREEEQRERINKARQKSKW